jgi:beta-lactamase regulating signal transducer with metallopeptidase domain
VNPVLASTAIGLLAAWPASGLGWTLGKIADAVTQDPTPRARAWNTARALPGLVLGLTIAGSALPADTTAPVVEILTASRFVATAGAVVDGVVARGPTGPNLIEAAGGLLIVAALVGLGQAVTRQLLGRRRLARIVGRARPASTDLTLAVWRIARNLDVRQPPVLVSAEVDQPLLAGLSEPVILLPAALARDLDTDRLVTICAHELGHLKRGDNWRLLVEHLMAGLFWMVPPVSALRARAAAVREEICDRIALDGAPLETRRGYAESLVEVLRARAAPTLHPAFTGKESTQIAMRLKAILDPRPSAPLHRRVMLTVAGVIALGFAGASSLALAHQDGLGRISAETTITSTDGPQRFQISSDYIVLPKQKAGNERLQIGQGQFSTFHGDVQIKGRLQAPQAVVLLDGKTPPAGFDPTTLPKGAIDRVELTTFKTGDKARFQLNVILAKTL